MVTAAGWGVKPMLDSGVYFRDTSQNADQVTPVHTDVSLANIIQEVMPIFTNDTILSYMGVLVSYFIPNILSPILNITGDPGSFKTGCAATTKQLADPSVSRLLISGDDMGKNNEELALKLTTQMVYHIDNITGMTGSQSDLISRGATGGTQTKRVLYTNRDTIQQSLQCGVILTGTNTNMYRVDIIDRTVNLKLQRFTGGFKEESVVVDEIMGRFPEMLGAIFNMVSAHMAYVGDAINPLNYRFVEYSTLTYIIANACGYAYDETLAAQQLNEDMNNKTAAEASQIVSWVQANITKSKPYYGTIEDLFDKHNWGKIANPSRLGKEFSSHGLTLYKCGYIKTLPDHNTRLCVIRVLKPGEEYTDEYPAEKIE